MRTVGVVWPEYLPGVVGFVQIIAAKHPPLGDDGILAVTDTRDGQVKAWEVARTSAEQVIQDATDEGNLDLVAPEQLHAVLDERLADLLVNHARILDDEVHVPAELSRVDKPIEHGGAALVLKAASVEPRPKLVENHQPVFVLVVAVGVAVPARFEIRRRWLVRNADVVRVPMGDEMLKKEIDIGRDAPTLKEGQTRTPHGEFRLTGPELALDGIDGHDASLDKKHSHPLVIAINEIANPKRE